MPEFDFDKVVRKRLNFNGKPFSHWDALANQLMADALVRAAMNQDTNSLLGYLVNQRLLQIAATQATPAAFKKAMQPYGGSRSPHKGKAEADLPRPSPVRSANDQDSVELKP